VTDVNGAAAAVGFVVDDLARARCHAIVNPAGESFALSPTGVNRALADAGGPDYERECEQLKHVKDALVWPTGAGRLDARFVLHAVVPVRVRLVLRTDRRGLPLAYTLVNEHEYEPLLDLVEAGETVIADKGLWGRAYNERMECAEVRLLTPARERTAANHARERLLAGTRLTIESVFANLKEQMRLERHLARTPRGLAQRIAQRLLALTLGILLNTLSGRPARALAAYDGR
jgi:hypothetical protein